MLATGGFPNNMEMRKNFCYDTYGRTSYMSPMCTGDGVRAAMAVGADLANTCQSYLFGEGAFYEATFNEEWEGVFPMWLADPEDPNKLVAEAPIIAETHGGVVINTDAQVLNVFGEVIPNLYAGGCDVDPTSSAQRITIRAVAATSDLLCASAVLPVQTLRPTRRRLLFVS